MKITIASDLHIERHADGGLTMAGLLAPADVLVLAGDIGTPTTLLRMLGYCLERFPHVVYVTGNHEYYGGAPSEVHAELAAFAQSRPNFHWLNNSATIINGQRFIGATLWFSRFPDWERYKQNMNDFYLIREFVPWVFDENAKSRVYLDQEILPTDIVVTHHLPSHQSVAPEYVGSTLDGFFVCDVEETILAKQPKVWVHGHTHTSCRYKIGATEVICNPFGYLAVELNRKFKQNLVIEV